MTIVSIYSAVQLSMGQFKDTWLPNTHVSWISFFFFPCIRWQLCKWFFRWDDYSLACFQSPASEKVKCCDGFWRQEQEISIQCAIVDVYSRGKEVEGILSRVLPIKCWPSECLTLDLENLYEKQLCLQLSHSHLFIDHAWLRNCSIKQRGRNYILRWLKWRCSTF